MEVILLFCVFVKWIIYEGKYNSQIRTLHSNLILYIFC